MKIETVGIIVLVLFLFGCSSEAASVDYSDDIVSLNEQIAELKKSVYEESKGNTEEVVCDNVELLASVKRVNDELERYNELYEVDYYNDKRNLRCVFYCLENGGNARGNSHYERMSEKCLCYDGFYRLKMIVDKETIDTFDANNLTIKSGGSLR